MATWYFKDDLRYAVDSDQGWRAYDDDDNDALEDAHRRGRKTCDVGRKYRVNLETMTQYRRDDDSKQRPVKREADKKKRGRDAELVGESVWVVAITGGADEYGEVVGVYSTRAAAAEKKRRKEAKLGVRPGKVFISQQIIK